MLSSFANHIPLFHTAPNLPYILDEYGRARIFHGTNFIRKDFPWYTESLLDEKNVAELAAMGMNTVRLSLQWTGAQPENGDTYNMSYYETTNTIINNLVKYNIIPFLDVHQDVMSTNFCLYDGFPKWAVNLSYPARHEFPYPLKPGSDGQACPWERPWSRNYFSEGCSIAFQTLYDEGTDMQNAFNSFYMKSAEYFANKPILGYEILNEPW
jgi:hypothetical protein